MRPFWMVLVGFGYGKVEKVLSFRTEPHSFVENLGRLADLEGQPLASAYFTFEALGLRGYLTKCGLSLFFHRVERDTLAKRETSDPWGYLMADREPLRTTIRWEQVDVELVGVCIDKEHIRKGLTSL